jgi:hypothetical protein
MSIEKFHPDFEPGVLRQESKPYTTISNYALQNCRDLEALGVWCYLQSKPENWTLNPVQLMRHFNLGKNKVYDILNRLIRSNLLVRDREIGSNGQVIKFNYTVLNGDKFYNYQEDSPMTSQDVHPLPDLPELAEPELVNRDITNKRLITNKRVLKNISCPTNVERFPEFWNLYPRKQKRKEALKAWAKVKPEDVDRILADLQLRKEKDVQWQDSQYIPLPASYLNGERWNDEIISAQPTKAQPKPNEPRSTVPWFKPEDAKQSQGVRNDANIIQRDTGDQPRGRDLHKDQTMAVSRAGVADSASPSSSRSYGIKTPGDYFLPKR